MTELFVKGGFMMYPILACSIIAMGIALERLIYLSAAGFNNRKFIDEAKKVNGDSNRLAKIRRIAERTKSPVSAILRAAIENADESEEKRNTIVWRVGSSQRRDLERNVNTLGIIAHITPLMGLLGTVVGMIRAFMTIQALGGQVDATDLAGGISEALITTAAGLSVAIPSMMLFHFTQGRVDNILSSIKDSAVLFPEILGRRSLAFSAERIEPAEASDGGVDHGV